MKFVALLALVLSQTTAWATEPTRFFTQEMRLDNTDARLMFSSMVVDPTYGSDGTGPFMKKTLQIGNPGAQSSDLALDMTCELLAGGDAATCKLTWTTTSELKAGKTIGFSQASSQAIISKLGLLSRPQLGQGWSGLDFSAFSLKCQEVYTPTDLPVYTACSISIAQ